MKNVITTICLSAVLTGCATLQPSDAFEAQRIAAGAVDETADLVCTGEGAAELTDAEAVKCAKLKVSLRDLLEALDAVEKAWEDLAPIIDKHTQKR